MKSLPLTKTYSGRRVLSVPEIELPEGKVTVLMGANGSGKSTYARLLAGLERADGGLAPYAGTPGVGYLPQKPYAFHMSTARNLKIASGDPAWERELAERMGLLPLLAANAASLSGGETARMALARLLARPFDLLILDEPSAALDMDFTLRSEEAVLAYRERFHAAVLLITHSVGQARRIGDRLLFFRQGELAEAGECALCLKRPETKELASFLEFYG